MKQILRKRDTAFDSSPTTFRYNNNIRVDFVISNLQRVLYLNFISRLKLSASFSRAMREKYAEKVFGFDVDF